MRIMTCKIELPGNTLLKEMRKPASIHVESTFKELISRAEIVTARNVQFFEKNKPRDVFKHGSPINIYFGYDNEMVKEFSGYITEVSADFPITIKCQDEMWKIKSLPVNYAATNSTLDKMLKAILPGYDIDALEGVELGNVRFAHTNVGAVLDKLNTDFKLMSYMNDKQLVCGKYYSDNTADKIETLNLDLGVASNGLQYRSGEDIIVKIKGSSSQPNGKKIDYEKGEIGGDDLSLSYRAQDLKDLMRQVDEDYRKKKLGGYDGNVTPFGKPYFKHGRKVKIVSTIYPDREGIYYIDGVTKDYDSGGIRQALTLGGIAA